TNLRKAAVLIRSLDADSAASLLAQLSADEASELRAAAQSLGPIDPEERADVLAEFRRAVPIAAKPAAHGVEVAFTTQAKADLSPAPTTAASATAAKRFEFLDDAPIKDLVPFLTREHVQTIAVVLSHLPPARAATVLAALPQRLQADTIERLSQLGESDPEAVVVVERELAQWMTKRLIGRSGASQRGDSVTSILAAADAATRSEILANLKTHKAALARQLEEPEPVRRRERTRKATINTVRTPKRPIEDPGHNQLAKRRASRQLHQVLNKQPSAPPLDFDELVNFSDEALAAVLREVDPNVLALALAGSREELTDRICGRMPKRVARDFRRRLGQLGPTRLSDVEAAQQSVARVAARRWNEQRTKHRASAV
ncbi:MAG TPA: FliG C-terminal domain-containing protein, partial [Lacipirellulaceae bacterium]|nr:FliG C-terminal domain-containing protein [Lacipirellulaceae bacterium]